MEPHACEAILFHETRVDPAEYCGEETEEDSAYCERHAAWQEDY